MTCKYYVCNELADVFCYAKEVPKNYAYQYSTDNLNMFMNSHVEYATLHVPAASIDAYKSTAPWSDFGNIVPLTQEEIDNYESTDIHTIVADKDVQQIYTLDGKPAKTLQKGVNIIRASDGTTKKVFVR